MNRSSSSGGVGEHKLDDGINGDTHANDRHIPVHHDEEAFEDEEVDVDDLPESMKPKLEKRKFKIDFLAANFPIHLIALIMVRLFYALISRE